MGVRGKARKAGQAQSVTNMPRSLDLALWVVVEPQKGSVQPPPTGSDCASESSGSCTQRHGQGKAGVSQEASGDRGQGLKTFKLGCIGGGEAWRRHDQELRTQ